MDFINQTPKIKTVIFDFDGTLIDSMVHWDKIILQYLKNHGITAEEGLINIIKPMGITDACVYMIEKYKMKAKKQNMVDELCSEMGQGYKNTIPLKPFAKEYIERINEDFNICVATANKRAFATSALVRTDLMQYIDYFVTIADVGAAKHSADIFLNCAEQFGNQPNECLIFEDSLMACQVAKKAGFKVVGVSDRTNLDEAIFMKQVCDKYIYSFKDIL